MLKPSASGASDKKEKKDKDKKGTCSAQVHD